MKKKILYALLLAVSVTALSACSKNPPAETTPAETTPAETTAETTPAATTAAPTTAAIPETTTVAETTAAPTGETMYVIATDVNVRQEASMEGTIVGTLNPGNSVYRISTVGEWSQIEYNGQVCYVSSQFLSAEEPETPAAPVEPQSGTGIYHAGGDILICIDAGHETHSISDTEPNGPGSSEMKAGVTSGTDGCSTGIPEYKVNLQVALKLRDELLSRGYSVIMTRETNDVTLSNIGRATIANDSGADMMIRLHCNSADSSSVRGALGITQTSGNPYCGNIYGECIELTNAVLDGYCNATGFANTGIWETDTMTGTNWCDVPNTILEMGYMSNPTEDELLCDSDFQTTAAIGIADGIDAYFGR